MATEEIGSESEASETRLPINVSLTPTLSALSKKIFEPSAELLGSELRLSLKNTIRDLKKKKREKNLKGHIKAVTTKLPPMNNQREFTGDAALRKLEGFQEWMDGAKDVGEDEKALALLWRNLLLQIMSNGKKVADDVRLLKKFSADDAEVFLRFAPFARNRHKFLEDFFPRSMRLEVVDGIHADRLVKLGVLKKDFRAVILMGAVSAFLFVTRELLAINAQIILFGWAVIFCFAILSASAFLNTPYKLTPRGMLLLNKLESFEIPEE